MCPVESNEQNEEREILTKEWEVKTVLKFPLRELRNISGSFQCSISFN